MDNLSHENNLAVEELKKIFSKNEDKRICVVGASCSGKSYLIKNFPEAYDMDDFLFGNKRKKMKPLLTKNEMSYACGPWSEEVGNFMVKKSRELIKIVPGHPVFGTIVFPSDLVVGLAVSDEALAERVKKRGADIEDVLNMKNQIDKEINKSDIPKVVVKNG